MNTKKDNKTLDNYIHQYTYAGNYVDRREAIEFALRKTDDPKAIELLKTALTDPYPPLRSMVISGADLRNEAIRSSFEPLLTGIAKSDKKTTVRASAIQKLGEYKNPTHAALFKSAINDSSYSIAGNALVALSKIEPEAAAALAIQLVSKPAKGSLKAAIMEQIVKSGDESMADKLIGDFAALPLGQEKFEMIGPLKNYLTVLKNPEKVKWGVDEIVKFREAVPDQFRSQTDFIINAAIKAIAMKKSKEGDMFKELVEYIKTKLPEADKKGF